MKKMKGMMEREGRECRQGSFDFYACPSSNSAGSIFPSSHKHVNIHIRALITCSALNSLSIQSSLPFLALGFLVPCISLSILCPYLWTVSKTPKPSPLTLFTLFFSLGTQSKRPSWLFPHEATMYVRSYRTHSPVVSH